MAARLLDDPAKLKRAGVCYNKARSNPKIWFLFREWANGRPDESRPTSEEIDHKQITPLKEKIFTVSAKTSAVVRKVMQGLTRCHSDALFEKFVRKLGPNLDLVWLEWWFLACEYESSHTTQDRTLTIPAYSAIWKCLVWTIISSSSVRNEGTNDLNSWGQYGVFPGITTLHRTICQTYRNE